MKNSRARFYICLYLLVAGVYLLTCAGRLGLSDSVAMYNVAQSMATEHSISAEPCVPDEAAHPNHCVPGVNGGHYSGFGLLPSAVAVPTVLVAREVARVVHNDSGTLAKVSVALLTALIAPLACVMLAMWILELGYSRKTALWGALILAFASSYWHFAVKGFYSEPYFTLALLISAYLLSRTGLRRGLGWAAAVAGLALGAACAARITGVILVPAFIVAILVRGRAQDWPMQKLVREVAWFCAGGAVVAALLGWANYSRFGSPFLTGYQQAYPTAASLLSNPFFTGLRDLLFQGEIGLLIFVPWVLFAALGWRRLFREHQSETVLCAGVFFTNLVFFAKYDSWHAGWVAGPRFLAPAIPFLIVIMAPWLERLLTNDADEKRTDERQSDAHTWKWALVALLAFAFAIQAAGMVYPDDRYYDLMALYQQRPVKPKWFGSIPLASASFVYHWMTSKNEASPGNAPRIVDALSADQAEQRLRAAIPPNESAEDYLRSFPNSENLTEPNLILVKMKWLRMPSALVYAYAIFAIGLAVVGFVGLRRTAGSEGEEDDEVETQRARAAVA